MLFSNFMILSALYVHFPHFILFCLRTDVPVSMTSMAVIPFGLEFLSVSWKSQKDMGMKKSKFRIFISLICPHRDFAPQQRTLVLWRTTLSSLLYRTVSLGSASSQNYSVSHLSLKVHLQSHFFCK